MAETLNVVCAQAPVTPENARRTKNGKFTLAQLRQTDGIVPLQSGTNKFDSQKGKTAFGTPRNTQTNVNFADDGKRWTMDDQQKNDTLIRLQSGTNKFESQKGMTSFGAPRDVRGNHIKRIWELEFPEECLDNQVYQQQQQQQQQQQPEMQPEEQLPQQPVQYQHKQYNNVQRR